jgi:hypothetical protein
MTGLRWNSTRFCVIECTENEPPLVGDDSHRRNAPDWPLREVDSKFRYAISALMRGAPVDRPQLGRTHETVAYLARNRWFESISLRRYDIYCLCISIN